MAKQPYIAFYIGDWFKDPNVNLCSPESRGVWIDFLCAMHELRSGGVLTADKDQLCRAGRCSHAQLDRAISELQTTKTADISERNGVFTIICRRMKREADTSASRAAAGSKGGSKRVANSDIEVGNEIEGCSWWKDPEFQKAWTEWQEHRESIRKPLSSIAKLKQIQNLKEIGRVRAIAAINLSVLRQWQGIYEDRSATLTASGNGHLNGAETVVLQKEFERVIARIDTLRGTYSGMQTWAKEDSDEIKLLRTRRDELKQKLGIQR